MLQYIPDSITNAAHDFASAATTTTFLGKNVLGSDLATATQVSGLRELAQGHANVLSGQEGSAYQVLKNYADQLQWVADNLNATTQALTTTDTTLRNQLDTVANTISTTPGDTHAGATVADSTQHFPTRPDTTITPFIFPPPIAHAEISLTWLANALGSTNTAAFSSAEHTWRNLANTLSTVVNDVRQAASDLASNNQGDTFTAAGEQINAIITSGQHFIDTAHTMATNVSLMNAIHAEATTTIAQAQAMIAALPNPFAQQAAEHAFLHAFASVLSTQTTGAIPPFNTLMDILGQAGEREAGHTGKRSVSGAGPTSVEPIAFEQTITQANTIGTGGSLEAVGATSDALQQVGTQHAVATPTAPTPTPGMSNAHTTGLGHAQGMHPSQVFATNPSAGSHGAFTPALEQLKATAAQHTTTGTTPTTGSGARPLITGLTGEKLSQQLSDKLTQRGTGGIGGRGGGGGTSLRSIGGIGGAGAALGTGSRGLSAGSIGGIGGRSITGPGTPGGGAGRSMIGSGGTPQSPTTTATGSNSASSRPMGPMMGAAPMAGAAGTTTGSGKTKPSISRSRRQGSVADFEREHNLRALLGPQRGLPSHSFGAWSLLPEHMQKQFPQTEFNKAMSHARRELRAGTFVADSPVKHAIAEHFFRKEGWDV
ncbi:hypothetical protein CARG_03110 [Corynebacterium argentoratense DSM 44202]|uniref:Uncharacterized protein n=1 Tax=Corynebacterium argentoratense DSM 44202 TaxID=1348662 RepID=U3GTY2_9CORY|nr:hypothetical protein [Corynebacterium argentoratense]AGU14774.1 hypothetical protein CARG_03110 [Corynebacterium argentoratense DSM 44202]